MTSLTNNPYNNHTNSNNTSNGITTTTLAAAAPQQPPQYTTTTVPLQYIQQQQAQQAQAQQHATAAGYSAADNQHHIQLRQHILEVQKRTSRTAEELNRKIEEEAKQRLGDYDIVSFEQQQSQHHHHHVQQTALSLSPYAAAADYSADYSTAAADYRYPQQQQHGYEQHHTGTTATATAYETLSSPYADQYPHSHSHHASVVHHGMDAAATGYDEYAAAGSGNTPITMDLTSRGVGDGMMLNNMTSAASSVEDRYSMNAMHASASAMMEQQVADAVAAAVAEDQHQQQQQQQQQHHLVLSQEHPTSSAAADVDLANHHHDHHARMLHDGNNDNDINGTGTAGAGVEHAAHEHDEHYTTQHHQQHQEEVLPVMTVVDKSRVDPFYTTQKLREVVSPTMREGERERDPWWPKEEHVADDDADGSSRAVNVNVNVDPNTGDGDAAAAAQKETATAAAAVKKEPDDKVVVSAMTTLAEAVAAVEENEHAKASNDNAFVDSNNNNSNNNNVSSGGKIGVDVDVHPGKTGTMEQQQQQAPNSSKVYIRNDEQRQAVKAVEMDVDANDCDNDNKSQLATFKFHDADAVEDEGKPTSRNDDLDQDAGETKTKKPRVEVSLQKIGHCRIHLLHGNAAVNTKGRHSSLQFCWQVTELYPTEVMVCCSRCYTWRHACCGGHYDYQGYGTIPTDMPSKFEAVCIDCHEEELVVKSLEVDTTTLSKLSADRMEHLRKTMALNEVMRHAAFGKHGGTYKWPLGSVTATHINGHTRSVHGRHEKALKAWRDLVTKLSQEASYRPKERIKVRTREFDRLLGHVEDAEGFVDRHNIKLFLHMDTMKQRPAGYEMERRNFFDTADYDSEEEDGNDENNNYSERGSNKDKEALKNAGEKMMYDNTSEEYLQYDRNGDDDEAMQMVVDGQAVGVVAISRGIQADPSYAKAVARRQAGKDGSQENPVVLDLTKVDAQEEQPSTYSCARPSCMKKPRFDSVYCSDGCGVSTLEKHLLRSLEYAEDVHPSLLRTT